MKILQSSENYLETILMLKKKNGFVRAVDIAHELDFSKASVSVALKGLRENGYVTVGADNALDLTDAGLSIAEQVFLRHTYLCKLLMFCGVASEQAAEDACKMEHVISDETLSCIMAKMDSLPQK